MLKLEEFHVTVFDLCDAVAVFHSSDDVPVFYLSEAEFTWVLKNYNTMSHSYLMQCCHGF